MALLTSDSFTGAAGTNLTSRTGETGATWSMGTGFSGNVPVLSDANRLRAGGSGGGVAFASGVATADGEQTAATVQTITTAAGFGIFARGHINLAGVARGYMAYYSSSAGVWKILRLDNASTFTQIGSNATQALSVASHSISLTVTGTGASVAVVLVVDGTTVLNVADTAAGRITTFGRAGVYFDTTASNTAGTHIDSLTYEDALAAPADSVDITSPADGRVFQIAGGSTGNASATFGGVYTGTAPNQWRVVDDGTSTPVTGLDWATFGSAPTGGTFSQTVSLPKGAGWYNFQVRNSGTPGTVYTSGKVGAGVLVHVDGQSQAWLWFSPTAYAGDSSLTPSPLLRVTGKQASTPNATWDVPATATMNASIACGNALVAALSCPVGLIDGSWDGSGLVVSGNGGQWISGGAAGNAYTSSAAALTAAGGAAAATVFIQGESDTGSSITQSAYYTGLGQMIALRRTAVGNAAHPYVLAILARDLTGTKTDAQREAIKAAQVQKCADADVYRVDRMDLPLHTDNVHHTAAGFKTFGERVARAVLAALGVVSTYRGPRIASAAQTVTPAVFDVTLTHDMGTDITPTSGITGFRATVAGAPVTISSASRQAADVVRLTLAATPASMPVVQYLYGTAPTITAVVKDNGVLTLPLEYSPGVTASAYVFTVDASVAVSRSVRNYTTSTASVARSVRGFVAATAGFARSVRGYASASATVARSISAAGVVTAAIGVSRSVRGYVSASVGVARSISAAGVVTASITVARRIGGYVTATALLRRSIEGDGSIVWPATRAGEANTARVPFDGVRVIVPDADDASSPVKAIPLYVADTERILLDWEAKYLPGAGDTAATLVALDAPAGLVVTPSVALGAALTTGVVVLAVTPTGAAGTYRVALRISTAGGRESTALVDVVVSTTVQSAKTFRLRSTADRDVFDLDFAAKYLAGAADVADVLLATSADAGLAADARLDVGGVVQVAVDNPTAAGTYQVRTQLQTAAGRRKTGAIAVEVLA